jgi:hypothetical protein
MGLLKGFGKAVGGVFLKPTAGTWNMLAISLRSGCIRSNLNQGYGV